MSGTLTKKQILANTTKSYALEAIKKLKNYKSIESIEIEREYDLSTGKAGLMDMKFTINYKEGNSMSFLTLNGFQTKECTDKYDSKIEIVNSDRGETVDKVKEQSPTPNNMEASQR